MNRSTRRQHGSGATAALGVALIALGSVAVLVALGRVPLPVLGVVLVASTLSFGLYAADKSAARRAARRVPESTLHLVDLLGGWPGGLVARHAFRHKTRKQPFRTVFWATAAVSTAVVGWLAATQPALPGVALSG